MLYEVDFLKEGEVLDRFTITANTPLELKVELARIRLRFHSARPDAKELMSVTAVRAWSGASPVTAPREN